MSCSTNCSWQLNLHCRLLPTQHSSGRRLKEYGLRDLLFKSNNRIV